MSETDEEGLRIAKEVAFGRVFGHKRFENILQKISIVSGGGGNITCEFEVVEDHRNSHGTLHGGLMSLLVDAVTSWALHTKVRDRNSASIDLSLRFIKPARVGETVVIEARTTRCGRRVAFLSAEIRSKESRQLLAEGWHTKLLMGQALQYLKNLIHIHQGPSSDQFYRCSKINLGTKTRIQGYWASE